MLMSFSFSRVNTYNDCPYKYKLQYVDKLETLPDTRPNNPLYIGTAGHTGIEERSIDKAIESYLSNYTETNENHEIEIYKLKKMVKKAISVIPEGTYEYKLLGEDSFIGFIDELVLNEDGTYTMYDFKFSQSASKYKTSGQLHVYKYYFEKLTGKKIREMYYAVVPKVPEVLNESMTKENLIELIDKTYDKKDVQFLPIEYDPKQISIFFARKALMDKGDKFGIYEKRYSTNCRWCEFQKYCSSNGKDRSEIVEKEGKVQKVEPVQLF